jgi:hypothetical protein
MGKPATGVAGAKSGGSSKVQSDSRHMRDHQRVREAKAAVRKEEEERLKKHAQHVKHIKEQAKSRVSQEKRKRSSGRASGGIIEVAIYSGDGVSLHTHQPAPSAAAPKPDSRPPRDDKSLKEHIADGRRRKDTRGKREQKEASAPRAAHSVVRPHSYTPDSHDGGDHDDMMCTVGSTASSQDLEQTLKNMERVLVDEDDDGDVSPASESVASTVEEMELQSNSLS